jgi:hypothetical protein
MLPKPIISLTKKMWKNFTRSNWNKTRKKTAQDLEGNNTSTLWSVELQDWESLTLLSSF